MLYQYGYDFFFCQHITMATHEVNHELLDDLLELCDGFAGPGDCVASGNFRSR